MRSHSRSFRNLTRPVAVILNVMMILIGGFVTGCQSSSDDLVPVKATINRYVEQVEYMNGDLFGRLSEEKLNALLEALDAIEGLQRQPSNTHAFMPQLFPCPGWFDFALAARTDVDDIYVYGDGRVRIFHTPENVYVLVLTERSNAITHRVGVPEDTEQ